MSTDSLTDALARAEAEAEAGAELMRSIQNRRASQQRDADLLRNTPKGFKWQEESGGFVRLMEGEADPTCADPLLVLAPAPPSRYSPAAARPTRSRSDVTYQELWVEDTSESGGMIRTTVKVVGGVVESPNNSKR